MADLPIPDLTGCENVLPLTDWLQVVEAAKGYCPPCNLAVITPWYRDLLRDQGFPDLAARIDAFGENEPDPHDLVRTLDEVKEALDNATVKDTLRLYDCMLQSIQEDSEI